MERVPIVDEKEAILKSFRILLEIMMAYGVAYKHYQDLQAHGSCDT